MEISLGTVVMADDKVDENFAGLAKMIEKNDGEANDVYLRRIVKDYVNDMATKGIDAIKQEQNTPTNPGIDII